MLFHLDFFTHRAYNKIKVTQKVHLVKSHLFFFQRLDACFVIPDGRNLAKEVKNNGEKVSYLCPKHDGREQGEQESLPWYNLSKSSINIEKHHV